MLKNLNTEDISTDTSIVTSGIWQDGASSLTGFFSSSTQYTNTGDYNIDVYRYDPTNNASASVQFGIVYGHRDGSGSLGLKGATGDRTTAAIFGQFNSLINPPETTTFTFSDNTNAKQFYAIVLNRARMREGIEAGGWELHLSSSAANSHVKLIDDSSTNNGGNNVNRNFLPEYNVVSGTLVGGTSIKTSATGEDDTMGSYGTFYPKLGIILLNPERLSGAPLKLVTASGSNADNRNNRLLFNCIADGGTDPGGQYFQMKRKEEITSKHYFVRATSQNFNATTNQTFYTESITGVKQIIPGLRTNPKTYITSVGLYNNADELLAIAKLSKPILKSSSREALIKVKLDF